VAKHSWRLRRVQVLPLRPLTPRMLCWVPSSRSQMLTSYMTDTVSIWERLPLRLRNDTGGLSSLLTARQFKHTHTHTTLSVAPSNPIKSNQIQSNPILPLVSWVSVVSSVSGSSMTLSESWMSKLSSARAICSVVGGDPGRDTGRERVDSVGLTSLPPPLPLLLPDNGISSRMNCSCVELQLRSVPFQSVELGRLLAIFIKNNIVKSHIQSSFQHYQIIIMINLRKLGCRLWTFSYRWILGSGGGSRG